MRGITTKQIRSAPHGAYFVCHTTTVLRNFKDMCHVNNRDDLHVITVSQLHHRAPMVDSVVVDHHVYDALSTPDIHALHETLAGIHQRVEHRRRHKHPRGFLGVIKNIKDFVWLFLRFTCTKDIHARCEFSRRFFDVHDYMYWSGGDGTPSHFHTYRCWNCGGKFRI
jgi:hypothetical protein